MVSLEQIRQRAVSILEADPKRLRHTQSVVAFALSLGAAHHADLDKVEAACWLHDVAKNRVPSPDDETFDADAWPEATHHARHAAIFARTELGITDPDILDAITYHTTGRPGMSLIEKIVFVADHIEPHRKGVPEKFRMLAHEQLDVVVWLILKRNIAYLEAHKRPVSRLTREAYDEYEYMGGNG
ncbi:MAG: bis(5'-nucleosyl)-tetraphosphatase (symmetrical) YqeK [Candidatus Izemoplasmatales bacterium]|jgi:nicotinate-nucleotide adenylyltransferase|nr:bis(5'-nucleosyl)-tetraphosphatase (symmetrical) YqeK [Candidatus Izemoplasmatales bacterium]MDD5293998.1 bis(5'-nucleosyl)-tetraphosphatase (symmetrical) YqeK [Candidatus Izemoplasmatales bacterium]